MTIAEAKTNTAFMTNLSAIADFLLYSHSYTTAMQTRSQTSESVAKRVQQACGRHLQDPLAVAFALSIENPALVEFVVSSRAAASALVGDECARLSLDEVQLLLQNGVSTNALAAEALLREDQYVRDCVKSVERALTCTLQEEGPKRVWQRPLGQLGILWAMHHSCEQALTLSDKIFGGFVGADRRRVEELVEELNESFDLLSLSQITQALSSGV